MRRFIPYVDIHLNLGFMGFDTAICRERFERDEYEYITIQWYLFKLRGGFRLYSPYRRLV